MANSESVLTLRDILKVLFKRQALIIIVTLVAMVTATVVVFLKPPVYESCAGILVRRSIPETQAPAVSSGAHGASTFFRQINQADEMNTAISVLGSRDLVESVIQKMAMTPEQFDKVPDFRRYVRFAYNGCKDAARYLWQESKYLLRLSRRPTAEEAAQLKHERFVNKVVKAVVVEQIPDSDVLRVGIHMNDPLQAEKFSRLFSEMALAWHFEKFRQTGNLAFFKEQADKSADELTKLEKSLADLRHEQNLIGIEKRRQLIIESRFQFEARLNTVLADLAAHRAGMKRIDGLLSREPETTTLSRENGINPLHQQVVDKIAALELRRINEGEKLTEQSRTLRDMTATLGGWKEYLKNVPPQQEVSVIEGLNNIRQNLLQKRVELASETAALEAEARVLRERISAYDRDLNNLNQGAYKVTDLERRIRSQETVYAQYLRNSEQARIADAKQQARMANLNIVQSAALPVRSIKPRKLLSILFATGGALLFSIAWAFAKEMSDTSFENEEQIRRTLALDALGTLPHIGNMDNSDPPTMVPDSLREPAQRLWTKLIKACPGETVAAAFVSSHRGEGATTVTLQAAMAALNANLSVLLVDAGPEKNLTRMLGVGEIQPVAGITEEGGLEHCIRPTQHSGLAVLPADIIAAESNAIDWQGLLQEVKKSYDVVLFDVGTARGNHPGSGLLSVLDGVVLVVAAHATRREIVQQTLAELRGNSDARVVGLALNRRRFFIPEFLYRIA